MDVHLAIASKRDVRAYAPGALDPATEARLLDAGRLTGSARNRQPARLVVAESAVARAAVAAAVYVPATAQGAALVVAVAVTPGGGLVDFDAGRMAQGMMIAAWADGIASCPNGVADHGALAAPLGLAAEERVVIVLTFGRPVTPRDPARRRPEEWSRRARRLPIEEVVRRA